MKQLLLIFLGGGLGSVLRYLTDLGLKYSIGLSFPYGTLAVNIVGSFILGVVLGLAAKPSGLNQNIILFIAIGLCGGYTTFSTFAYESFKFLQQGDIGSFILYVLVSLVLCLSAIGLALYIIR